MNKIIEALLNRNQALAEDNFTDLFTYNRSDYDEYKAKYGIGEFLHTAMQVDITLTKHSFTADVFDSCTVTLEHIEVDEAEGTDRHWTITARAVLDPDTGRVELDLGDIGLDFEPFYGELPPSVEERLTSKCEAFLEDLGSYLPVAPQPYDPFDL